jgi:hypothetical protein
MNLLVLTSEPITADDLGRARPESVDPRDAQVMLVAPALQDSPLQFWVSDADDAIARARQVQSESMQHLSEEGIAARGDTGEGEPLQAIQDALATFPADRIALFVHKGDARTYREDVGPDAVQDRFGVPVDRVSISGIAG